MSPTSPPSRSASPQEPFLLLEHPVALAPPVAEVGVPAVHLREVPFPNEARPRVRTHFFQVCRPAFRRAATLGYRAAALYVLLAYTGGREPEVRVDRQWVRARLRCSLFRVVAELAKLAAAGLLLAVDLGAQVEAILLDPGTGKPLVHRAGQWFWLNEAVIADRTINDASPTEGEHSAHMTLDPAALAVLACLAADCGSDQVCTVDNPALARSAGLAGRSSVAKPLRTLEQLGLLLRKPRHRITGGQSWSRGGHHGVRNGRARQLPNRYLLLDLPKLRPGAERVRSEVGAAAENVFRCWVAIFQQEHGTWEMPYLKRGQRAHLRELIELVMEDQRCSAPEAEQYLIGLLEFCASEGMHLPEPDTLYYRVNQIEAHPAFPSWCPMGFVDMGAG